MKEASGKAQLGARGAKQEFLGWAYSVISKVIDPIEENLYKQERSLSKNKNDIAFKISMANKFLSRLDEAANQLIQGYYNK